MGKETGISWCHHTFNAWWGCVKVSPACRGCYALDWDRRWGGSHWGADAPRRFFGDKHWAEPLKWDRDARDAGERRRVFCSSMADVFEDRADLVPHRVRLYHLIEETPWLDWLLLTKRPGNIRRFATDPGIPRSWTEDVRPNVWYGTTAEDQEWADRRIPELLAVPAAVRFLSLEPLLGPIDLMPYIAAYAGGPEGGRYVPLPNPGIHWAIVGGESGSDARPMNPDWARSIRDQCLQTGVAFHFKQWGEFVGGTSFCRDDGIYVETQRGDLVHVEGSIFGREWHDWSPDEHEGPASIRVGVRAAGRELDGRTWDEVPTPAGVGRG